MRPINADALIALVQDSTILGDGFKQAFCALVNGEPTIEPERKPGKWILADTYAGKRYRCSECLAFALKTDDGQENLSDYCPVCGARMEGEDDGFR